MNKVPPTMKISSLFLVIILVTFVLAVAALYQTIDAYGRGDIGVGINFAMIGASTLALSAYMIFQTRKKMIRLKLAMKIHRISTTILCQKCGFKTIRDFQREDYVFKEVEECPKCKEKMLVSSIYREVDNSD